MHRLLEKGAKAPFFVGKIQENFCINHSFTIFQTGGGLLRNKLI